MNDLQWVLSGKTWALHRSDPLRNGRQIFQYVRWSESAEQYVDMHGASLGTDIEKAKQQVEAASMSDCPDPLCPDSPDGQHHAAPIGSDEDLTLACTDCWYCGEKATHYAQAKEGGDGG